MARALYLTHKELYPVCGGDQVRFTQMASLLADHYEVDVLSLTHDPRAQCPDVYDSRLASGQVFYVPPMRRYLRASRTLVNRLPEFINHYRDPRLLDYVRRHASRYDLVLCGSAAMAQYAEGLDVPRRLVDLTDSFTLNYRNAARASRGLRSLVMLDQARRMARYEWHCRTAFDRVAYISETDRRYIPAALDHTCVVGNWVDIPERSAAMDSPDVLFVGRMDYEPNILGARFMAAKISEVLPAGGTAKLRIVGAAPVPEVVALESELVHVTGRVPDLQPFFDSAALVVAPMLAGSGIQNKILQAMAHGCCVLTTPIGAEGLDVASGAFAVAEPETFHAAAAELLADADRRAAYGRRAREYVAEHFSRRIIAGQFRHFIGWER